MSEWPQKHDLVRYGAGSTALAACGDPHAGGWHGDHCLGGTVFFLARDLYRPGFEDMETWMRTAKDRRSRPTTITDLRVMAALREKGLGHGLTFEDLRAANVERIRNPAFSRCESEWVTAHWMQATMGELGELANLMKKVDRGDMPLDEALPAIARELADVQCYLDIMALKLGVDLGDATIQKFNEVSDRIGSDVKL